MFELYPEYSACILDNPGVETKDLKHKSFILHYILPLKLGHSLHSSIGDHKEETPHQPKMIKTKF